MPDELVEPSEDFRDSPTGAHAFRVALPTFEGPLDLLLHLIREHQIDILDIPVALITEKYLDTLERMREVNLDIAGEFLVMAATLTHLKSRMLLPREEVATQLDAVEEQADPREELVRRLLDYQRYKDAGEQLARRPILGRDVFVRRQVSVDARAREASYLEISVYRLIEALDQVLQNAAPEVAHEVRRERLSITQAMVTLASRVRRTGTIAFFELFEGERSRDRIVVLFLGLLEMCKRRWLRVTQAEGGQEILVSAQGDALEAIELPEVDEREYN